MLSFISSQFQTESKKIKLTTTKTIRKKVSKQNT